jgi:hypothetical protein
MGDRMTPETDIGCVSVPILNQLTMRRLLRRMVFPNENIMASTRLLASRLSLSPCCTSSIPGTSSPVSVVDRVDRVRGPVKNRGGCVHERVEQREGVTRLVWIKWTSVKGAC